MISDADVDTDAYAIKNHEYSALYGTTSTTTTVRHGTVFLGAVFNAKADVDDIVVVLFDVDVDSTIIIVVVIIIKIIILINFDFHNRSGCHCILLLLLLYRTVYSTVLFLMSRPMSMLLLVLFTMMMLKQ